MFLSGIPESFSLAPPTVQVHTLHCLGPSQASREDEWASVCVCVCVWSAVLFRAVASKKKKKFNPLKTLNPRCSVPRIFEDFFPTDIKANTLL